MYKLELIWINNKENKFFEDSEEYKQDLAIEFNLHYLKKHKLIKPSDSTKDIPHEISILPIENNGWKKISRIYGFESPEAVEAFYLDGAKEKRFEYPETKRKWQQDNHIAAEVNILDENNNLVKLLSSCHGNICVKFGTCDSNDSCNIKPSLPAIKSGKFPIFHIKELNL
jgi:hypothetical protein